MSLNDSLRLARQPRVQVSAGRDANSWRQPEPRVPVGMRNGDTNAGLLTGDAGQAELSVAYDRGRLGRTLIAWYGGLNKALGQTFIGVEFAVSQPNDTSRRTLRAAFASIASAGS